MSKCEFNDQNTQTLQFLCENIRRDKFLRSNRPNKAINSILRKFKKKSLTKNDFIFFKKGTLTLDRSIKHN